VKIKLIWIVRPIGRVVEIYQEGRAVDLLDIEGELQGNPILPDFKLPVRELFEDLDSFKD
jgi:Uma2 family endonuclease